MNQLTRKLTPAEIDGWLADFVALALSPRTEAGWLGYSQFVNMGMPRPPSRPDKKDELAIEKAEALLNMPGWWTDMHHVLWLNTKRRTENARYIVAVLCKHFYGSRQEYRGTAGTMDPVPYTDEIRATLVGMTPHQLQHNRKQGYKLLADHFEVLGLRPRNRAA